MVIRDYHQTIKTGYEGGHERKGRSESTWIVELGMMNALKMYPMRGTGMEGGWIWSIISQDGIINAFMGILVIYPNKVVEATTCA